jgi:hypothetical protein
MLLNSIPNVATLREVMITRKPNVWGAKSVTKARDKHSTKARRSRYYLVLEKLQSDPLHACVFSCLGLEMTIFDNNKHGLQSGPLVSRRKFAIQIES